MLAPWNDGAAKSASVDFVARVTQEGGPEYVRPAERIATFDNDGTLWCEQPVQVQIFFARVRLEELAVEDPSMRERQPFKALDAVYQIIAFRAFYPGEAVIVALLLAFVPYLLLRGHVARVAVWWMRRARPGEAR